MKKDGVIKTFYCVASANLEFFAYICFGWIRYDDKIPRRSACFTDPAKAEEILDRFEGLVKKQVSEAGSHTAYIKKGRSTLITKESSTKGLFKIVKVTIEEVK